MRSILVTLLVLSASIVNANDGSDFNVSEWLDSLPKYVKDRERVTKLSPLIKDFARCIQQKKGSIGFAEAKIICGATLQASISKLGNDLEKISEKVFLEKVREQAIRNLSKSYLEQVLTTPIFSNEEEKSVGGFLGGVRERHTGQTFCELEIGKCSPQLARDLLKDKNEILKKVKREPPKSIFSRSKLWRQEYAEILNTQEKQRQCPEGNSQDRFFYASSTEVKKLTAESGFQKYTDEVLDDLYQSWSSQIKGDTARFDPLATTQSIHENELFGIFKNVVENDWEKMRTAGSALLNKESFDMKTSLKDHAFEVGQMLFQYPAMLTTICDAITSEQAADLASNEKNDMLKAIESGAVTPSNELNHVLADWLKGKTLKCEKIIETYKSKKPNNTQLAELKKENAALANSLGNTITSLDRYIDGVKFNRVTIDEAIGIYKGCDAPEYELYKKDIYIRSIGFFKSVEKNEDLRNLLARQMASTKDEVKKQKIVLLMGFMARLPTEPIPGVNSLTQSEIIKNMVKQYPEGTKPTSFYYFLEYIVKDKDLPQCLMPEPQKR